MAKIREREKAHEMRRKGLSIGEVANKLQVSKSTVSYWCRDIVLSASQVKHLQHKQNSAAVKALLASAEKKRLTRIKRNALHKTQGYKDVGRVSKRDLFILGLGLYWGEGYKKGNQEVGFTNSEPQIIKIMLRWFSEIYNIDRKDFILRVGINKAHKSREKQVLVYWSRITKIPKSQFTKTSFIKTVHRKHYQNKEVHFGTLRVKVRNGSALKQRILGSLNRFE